MTFDALRGLTIGVLSAIAAFLEPIGNDLATMVILFVVNIALGLLADISQGGSWDKSKMCDAFKAAFLFFALVTMIYVIGYLKHNMSGSLQCVSFISYTLLWFYGTNICRNTRNSLRPGSVGWKVASFLYYVLSLEGIRYIPFLQSFLKSNKSMPSSAIK